MGEDAKNGWVSLYRKSIDSSVFRNADTWYVWSWCLMKANHKTVMVPFNGSDIEIKRGQFITGREKALKEMSELSPKKYRNAIKYLERTNRIHTDATNKFTIITVCKYDEYQNNNLIEGQPEKTNGANQGPTKGQPRATNNNVNNENNENKEKALPPSNFIDKIIEVYIEVFPDTVNAYSGKNRNAVGRLLRTWKGTHPEQTTEETLTSLKEYFTRCKNISDAWYAANMSLSLIDSKFTEIGRILNNPKRKHLERPQVLDSDNLMDMQDDRNL